MRGKDCRTPVEMVVIVSTVVIPETGSSICLCAIRPTEGDSGTGRFEIDPKAVKIEGGQMERRQPDPGEHHNEDTGEVRLKDEIADASFQLKDERETLI